jgi:hypothetical protein
MTSLTVTDLIREGRYETAVIRMQELCRIQDPEVELDPAVVTAQYWEMRQRLRAVVPPAPFKVVVDLVGSDR